MLNKTSFHLWDNWYFQMFLLRDGSLFLIYTALSIVFVMLWDSLPAMEKLSSLVQCGVNMVIDGEKDSWDVPLAFPHSPCRPPYVLLITIQPVPPIPVYDSIFLCDAFPFLWAHQEATDGNTSLKEDLDLIPIIPQMFLKLDPFVWVPPYGCCCGCC